MSEYGNWSSRYMFTGQDDDETGLYNYRARLYDPVLKRFLDTDPAGRGFSPYAYVSNNPISLIDPTVMIDEITHIMGYDRGYNRVWDPYSEKWVYTFDAPPDVTKFNVDFGDIDFIGVDKIKMH